MDKQIATERFQRALEEHKPEFEQFFLAKFFGLNISYGQESCLVEVEVEDYMFNPQGSLHGGIITFIQDVSMGHLCKKFLGSAVTLEIKVNFLKAIYKGKIRCEAMFLKKGRKIVVVQSNMYNGEGVLVSTATGTWNIL